jgi:hypothetical protein
MQTITVRELTDFLEDRKIKMDAKISIVIRGSDAVGIESDEIFFMLDGADIGNTRNRFRLQVQLPKGVVLGMEKSDPLQTSNFTPKEN